MSSDVKRPPSLRWLWLGAVVVLLLSSILVYGFWPKEQPKPRPKKPVWRASQALRPTAALLFQDQGELAPLLRSLNHSLLYLSRVPARRTFPFGPHTITRQQMIDSLLDIKQKLQQWGLKAPFFQYLQQHYTFYQSTAPRVLFTGYFEAHLRGSLQASQRYRYPLYRKPPDLYRVEMRKFPFYQKAKGIPRRVRARLTSRNKIVPYYSREEIDIQHKLAGKNLELVWVDDPIDVFFLHIQGSGIVTLPDGAKLRVNYADQNGHPYKAIGRYMLQKKMLARGKVSMQSIRAYLQKHPKQQQEIFNYNPSYIFFRTVKQGPQGSLGVPVTAYRSIATDRRLFPKGALCLIQTQIPVFSAQGKITQWKSLTRLVLNQDTGGAIRGPGRVDLFTGFGRSSELVAGHLAQSGSLYFLLKR